MTLDKPFPNAERQTVQQLCTDYQVDLAHGQHVGALTVQLFQHLRQVHQLPARLEQIGYYAGLLHNVALEQGVKKHHTRGRDIILGHPLVEIADQDRVVIAVCTAFHRKRWTASRLEDEPSSLMLPAEDQPHALALAALVRLADGLDYSQSQSTRIVSCQVNEHSARIVCAGPFSAADTARADEKSDLWHDLFSTRLVFSSQRPDR